MMMMICAKGRIQEILNNNNKKRRNIIQAAED
jgi:hypothetical protein